MLETSFPDIEVVGECASVAESVARLREKPDEADLIFMDVELSRTASASRFSAR